YLIVTDYLLKYKPGTNFRGWLFTIMKNTFINNYRRNARSKAVVITEENISSTNLLHSSTRNNGELKFINEDIFKALKTLPSSLYDPFMKYFEGYKYHEIAKEFDMPVGTVKTRIHHARMHLKKYLKVYADLKGKIN
ncbi:MAG: RNA polymerase sigma factor, partial [Sphingobacteriales bacterium]